jgi:Family of unknown function (DUF6247)
MTTTPEAPADADLIAERLLAPIGAAEDASQREVEVDFVFRVEGNTVVLLEIKRHHLVPQELLDRFGSGKTHRADLQLVAQRLREHLADSVMERLQRLDEEREFKPQWSELGPEFVAGERDPSDPLVIHRDLPPEHREAFEHDYLRALRAARDPKGFVTLRRTLLKWRRAADVLADPAYQAEAARSLAAVESGDFSGYAPLDFDRE